MVHLALWWLWVELLGLIALPLTFTIFKNLPDRGYGFSKILGIFFVSFLLWLTATVGFLPNSQWTILLIILILALLSLFFARRHLGQLSQLFRHHRTSIIATETLFLLLFFLWAAVRAHNPDIIHTEQPMDLAFLNGILRSEHFPPNDPWFSGHHINYYYFGYLIVAMVSKLTAVPASIGYNLGLALVSALAAIGVFSIVFNLVKMSKGNTGTALRFGLIGCAFLLILGNLEPVLELLYAWGLGGTEFWQWVGIKGMLQPPQGGLSGDWWWHSSRVINTFSNGESLDFTITESPFFSFMVGDLHPHFMALPFTLLCLAVCMNILVSRESTDFASMRRSLPLFFIIGLLLGGLGFINSWDLITCTFVFMAALLMRIYIGQGESKVQFWRRFGILAGITLFGVFLPYLPFYFSFESPVSGILPWQGPNSRPFHLILIWGFFAFLTISFVVVETFGRLKSYSHHEVLWCTLFVFLPFILWAIFELVMGRYYPIWQKLYHLIPILAVLVITLLVIIRKVKESTRESERSTLFVLLLIFTSLFLITGCELFHVCDLFKWRMNTVFKLYYQAWVMLAIASAFGLYFVSRHWKVKTLAQRWANGAWWGIFTLLLVGCSLFPALGVTGGVASIQTREPTLDGLEFLHQSHPSEYEAIQWLNGIEGTPVILEAVGNDYTQYGRVSECTGLPTVIGWPSHEWQWRPSAFETINTRKEDVDFIYRSTDIKQVNKLLNKYNVSYVYVGYLEHSKYEAKSLEKFANIMDIAFQQGEVTIYLMR